MAVAILVFSTYEVVSKTMSPVINPYQLTFVRFLIGGLILLPISLLDIKKRKLRFGRKDILWMVFLGFLLVFVSMNMVQFGINFISASLAAVLFSSNPLFISALSAVFLKEKLNLKKVTGLLIGAAGVVVTFVNALSSNDQNFVLGIVLCIAATIVFSLYAVLGKKATLEFGSVTVTSFSSIFGCATMIPLLAAQNISPFAFDALSILPQLIYISVVVTGIAYFCYFSALAKLDTSLGSMAFFIKPILASVFAAIFLGETITVNIILGMALVLLGMYVVRQSVQDKKTKKSEEYASGYKSID
jgi:drug/metabolite transporter (DMT)-like permease